tara:strand:- start:19 stop:438 length:420 start_codon:yes stop_codon:yes gene_type:complete
MKGIKNENRRQFFSNFNESLLSKILEIKNGVKKTSNYKTTKEVDSDHVKWCSKNGMTKTEHINSRIIQDVYNVLTPEGAIKIISKGETNISVIAQTALRIEDGVEGFCDFIKERCESSGKQTLVKKHGADVINAILKHK